MSSQFEFAMHPLDEVVFTHALLADAPVQLINGPRWPRQSPELTPELTSAIGDYVLVWPGDPVPLPTAAYVPTVGDWYCNSEGSTLQFLRSRLQGDSLITGRIAMHDFPDSFSAAAGKHVTALFNRLRRLTRTTYTNSVVCWGNPNYPYAPAAIGRSANPSEPDPRLWVGPHALRWLHESGHHVIRQFAAGVVEGRPAVGGR